MSLTPEQEGDFETVLEWIGDRVANGDAARQALSRLRSDLEAASRKAAMWEQTWERAADNGLAVNEYVKKLEADLEAARAEVERLRAALEYIANGDRNSVNAGLVARQALSQTKDPV